MDKSTVLHGLTTLVVEDSLTQATKLEHLLTRQHCNVLLAEDGLVALKVLQDNHVDLVISDVVMPKMDGFELCEQIKSNPEMKDIPVVLLTSLTDPRDIIHGLKSGADNFLTKPYEDTYLLTRLQHIMINKEIRAKGATEMGMEVYFAGERFFLSSERMQMIDLLLSTYDAALQKNKELIETNEKLKEALNQIKTLHGLIPICASCKKIRNDEGYWQMVEEYITEHADVQFSHGICPSYYEDLYGNQFPELTLKMKQDTLKNKDKGKKQQKPNSGEE
ncbi:MAG: hypothetical protein Kow0037_21870 [Calditrichia bacterium]